MALSTKIQKRALEYKDYLKKSFNLLILLVKNIKIITMKQQNLFIS